MKKNIVALVSLLAVGILSGCGTSTSTASEAQGKTILSVATYDGGVGKAWLDNAKKRFEEKYKDTSFETGKTGVYVQIYGSKAYNGTSLLNKDLDRDVYYTEDVTYFDHVAKKQFLDISDLVAAPLTDYGENKSIADKLDSQYKAFLTSGDGKYYAIPFYDGFYGFFYDVDLFDANSWYFDEAGDLYASATTRSKGPDNVAGTADDGLPRSYEEFGKLFEAIRNAGDVPFSYSGANKVYLDRALMNVWADYEGKDQMLLNYTFNGTANDLVSSFNGATPVVGSEAVTFKNGYELQKQAGKYFALSFLSDVLLANKDNYKINSYTQLDAQTNFIKGNSGISGNPTVYAMHVDGTWWENEADSTFSALQTQTGKGKKDRKFAFLPFPKAVAASGTDARKQTLVSQNNSYCFINSKTNYADLAKKFVAFTHTDSELSAFTATTSITRSLSYALTSADEANTTYYGKSVINAKNASDIIYPYSTISQVKDNAESFSNQNWSWSSVVNGESYNLPFQTFLDAKLKSSSLSASDYFNGLYTAFQRLWKDEWKQ